MMKKKEVCKTRTSGGPCNENKAKGQTEWEKGHKGCYQRPK